jgi:cysteine desulfuration protein SufE
MTRRLQEAVDTFAGVDVETRRLLLMDYANELPDLPEPYRTAMEHGAGRVHECQSPVFVFPQVEDGTVRLRAYAPPESPTVRGVVSLLAQTLDGALPQDVLALPDDLFHQMGLVEAIGMMRQRGLSAVLGRIKYAVAEAAA